MVTKRINNNNSTPVSKTTTVARPSTGLGTGRQQNKAVAKTTPRRVTQTASKSTGIKKTVAKSQPARVGKATVSRAVAPRKTTTKSLPSKTQLPSSMATLTFDIGGTGLKASLVSDTGKLLHERLRIPTPYPCYPETLVENLIKLSTQLPKADRVAVGFPGMVRNGIVLTAPNLSLPKGPGKSKKPSKKIADMYSGFNLKQQLEKSLSLEVHVVNDADLAGAGAIKGRGLEIVATLGTGFGTGMFFNGKLLPHMEIAHLNFKNNKSFDEIIGDAARKSMKINKWSKLVLEALDILYSLTHYDHLYLGGGNASRISVKLPSNTTIISNLAAIKGGPKLFEAI